MVCLATKTGQPGEGGVLDRSIDRSIPCATVVSRLIFQEGHGVVVVLHVPLVLLVPARGHVLGQFLRVLRLL